MKRVGSAGKRIGLPLVVAGVFEDTGPPALCGLLQTQRPLAPSLPSPFDGDQAGTGKDPRAIAAANATLEKRRPRACRNTVARPLLSLRSTLRADCIALSARGTLAFAQIRVNRRHRLPDLRDLPDTTSETRQCRAR